MTDESNYQTQPKIPVSPEVNRKMFTEDDGIYEGETLKGAKHGTGKKVFTITGGIYVG